MMHFRIIIMRGRKPRKMKLVQLFHSLVRLY